MVDCFRLLNEARREHFRRLKPCCKKRANCMLNGSNWFVHDSPDLFESSPTDPKLSDSADGTTFSADLTLQRLDSVGQNRISQ
jgi:hypothetical protein